MINLSPYTNMSFAFWFLVLKFFNLTLNQPSIFKFLSINPMIAPIFHFKVLIVSLIL